MQLPLPHGAAPSVKPSTGETKVTDCGAKPAGAALCAAPVGEADGDGAAVAEADDADGLGDATCDSPGAPDPLGALAL